jgi:hypothetical protein
MKKYYNTNEWTLTNSLGGLDDSKSITIHHHQYNIDLVFKDVLSFITPQSLADFVKSFSDSSLNENKGCFPYEVLDDNYIEALNRKEPYPIESFYSRLKRKTITNEQYNEYFIDMKLCNNHWDYLKMYNINDVKIMINPTDNLINIYAEHKINMLEYVSLASCASAMSNLSMVYPSLFKVHGRDFDPNKTYVRDNKEPAYQLTQSLFNKMVFSYERQDIKAGRDTTNNITNNDYNYFKQLLKDNNICPVCGHKYTSTIKPSLDRINNNEAHTKSNCQWMCISCNKIKSDNDNIIIQKYLSRLNNYYLYYNLPMTLTDDRVYKQLREGITGGLSNVFHRVNIAGQTKINKLTYDPITNSISDTDTDNVMTHVHSYDANSLYPSARSSNPNPLIKLKGRNKLLMPGRLLFYTTKKEVMNRIVIDPKDLLYVVSLKGHIDKQYLNDYINFLPIIRNYDIINDEEHLGPNTIAQMNKVFDSSFTKTDRKLTNLASTMNEYMSFSTYYLEFLLQDCHFIIDELKSMSVYNSNTAYNVFTNYFFNERIRAKKEGNKLRDQFCKIVLNSSYGMDALNTEKYNRTVIVDRNQAFINQLKDTFVSTETLKKTKSFSSKSNDLVDDSESYVQQLKPQSINCKTALASAYFTLDNGKYWILNFIYNVLYKCLDKNRFHFIETDTDSLYFAVAGKTDSEIQLPNYDFEKNNFFSQGFNNIITDGSQWDIISSILFKEKKLLGFEVEKTGSSMIAIAPKQYTLTKNRNDFSINNDGIQMNNTSDNETILKNKGINTKTSNICYDDYLNVALTGECKEEKDIYEIRTIDQKKVLIKMDKWALTGIHNKMKVMPNNVCYPFIQ